MTTDSTRGLGGTPRKGSPNRSRPPHVLLIEDDDVMREMLAEALRHEGYRVTESAEALAWLLFCIHHSAREHRDGDLYDVVVSDIRMPNIGGLDALRLIHDIRCADACPPTIFITAFGDEKVHETAHSLGAVAVVNKPFHLAELIDKVREVISP